MLQFSEDTIVGDCKDLNVKISINTKNGDIIFTICLG